MGNYYDVLWNNVKVSKHVWISNGATWQDVKIILKEY